MTTPNPNCHDPALDIIDVVMQACRDIYDPNGECPPAGLSAVPTVRFFAWAGAPLAAWDNFMADTDDQCAEPFIWVRSDMRFRTKHFPDEEQVVGPCTGQPAIALEVGIGRCAFQESAEVDWATMTAQTGISIDDSWRMERILCVAATRLNNAGYSAAFNTILPYGPQGGLSAWSGMIIVGW